MSLNIKIIDDKSAIKKNTHYQVQEPHSKEALLKLISMIDEDNKVMQNGDFSCYIVENVYVTVTHNYDMSSAKNEYFSFLETKMYYETYIKPNIGVARWVLNIFNGEAEHEPIYIDTETFVVLPDPKWDRKKENIYLLALSKNVELYSLRDLRAEHIPLLKDICHVTLQYISEHYDIMERYIRVFLHYYPSTWRLHIHFQHISSNISLGGNTQVGRAHLISTVISNLGYNTNYYRDITLECIKSVPRVRTTKNTV